MQCEGEESEDELPVQHGVEVEGEDSESEDEPEIPAEPEAAEKGEGVEPEPEAEAAPQEIEEENPSQKIEKEEEEAEVARSYLYRESVMFRELEGWAEARKESREKSEKDSFSFMKKMDTSIVVVADTHSDGSPLPKHLKRLRMINQNLHQTNKENYQILHDHRARVVENLHSKTAPLSSQSSATLLSLQRTSRNLSSVSLSLVEAVSSLPQFWNIYGIDAEQKKG
eukprot:TRINITY_DN612_c1_g1_i1.p1 TRINITY_DN612_c1_g1~~TRINITY_DN612_c1_g1_i1.p1  ORF type:complete len:226 (+),score=51.88 TRINITY_DN612_c1_g1_i1:72-749(+)